MNSSTAEIDLTIEQERQQRLKELSEESGKNWLDQFRPGTAGCHELLDRAHIVADMVERLLIEHPACAQDSEWFRLASRAAESLHDLYQQVGAASLSGDDDPSDGNARNGTRN